MLYSISCFKFVENEGWQKAAKRYDEFIRSHIDLHTLYLELGVGMNTPVIIKYPFWKMIWKMIYRNPKAVYACLNYSEAYAPDEIQNQSICINDDILDILISVQS